MCLTGWFFGCFFWSFWCFFVFCFFWVFCVCVFVVLMWLFVRSQVVFSLLAKWCKVSHSRHIKLWPGENPQVRWQEPPMIVTKRGLKLCVR